MRGLGPVARYDPNQRGELVATAAMTGQVPGPPDRQRLQAMLDQGDPHNPLR